MGKVLESMRRNPAGDWSIRDVEKACGEANVRCEPPRGCGSHYKIFDDSVRQILTIPFKRPIKPVYPEIGRISG